MNFEYRCIGCGRNYEAGAELMYVCPVCSLDQKPMEPIRGVLRVILPYDKLSTHLDRYSFHPHELLPIEQEFLPNYPVGNTPLLSPERIRADFDFPNLYIKDDSRNPSGSLKDRASFLIAGLAAKTGQKKVVVASTGNAASAMAGVAAACGLECVIFVPETAPKAKLLQSMICGARVITVKGSYDDAFELSLRYSEKRGGINRNTAYNPFTIEGKKTAALEIFTQLEQREPDYIFIPTGDGVVLSGIYKGFYDMFQFDWIPKMPRLIAVQAEGSGAIVSGIKCNRIETLKHANTIADSICVAAPRNGVMALKDIDRSDGFGVLVSDNEIMDAQKYLGENAGLFTEPAAAAAFAGFVKYRDKLESDATAVVLSTGHGLKDISATMKSVTLPNPIEPEVDVTAL